MTEPDIRVCVYDNPATMQRECWQNGKIICSYTASLLPPFAKTKIPAHLLFFGANIGEWITGQLIGNKDAVDREQP
jgi:hypothetical protein